MICMVIFFTFNAFVNIMMKMQLLHKFLWKHINKYRSTVYATRPIFLLEKKKKEKNQNQIFNRGWVNFI